MRGQDGGRIDDGVASEGGLFAQALIYPGCGQAEGGLKHMFTGKIDLTAARVHDHQEANPNLAAARFHLLDADRIALIGQAHIVENTH